MTILFFKRSYKKQNQPRKTISVSLLANSISYFLRDSRSDCCPFSLDCYGRLPEVSQADITVKLLRFIKSLMPDCAHSLSWLLSSFHFKNQNPPHRSCHLSALSFKAFSEFISSHNSPCSSVAVSPASRFRSPKSTAPQGICTHCCNGQERCCPNTAWCISHFFQLRIYQQNCPWAIACKASVLPRHTTTHTF